MTLAVVSASTDLLRAESCLRSWRQLADTSPAIYVVLNGEKHIGGGMKLAADLGLMLIVHNGYLGTVPAFQTGTEAALAAGADIIACLHDDVEILEENWDDRVIEHFRRHPKCGLAGFGGAVGLGDEDMYDKPYNPMSLARKGFRSNMRHAEAHGIRSTLPEKVACLDGFSQIGRKEFWAGQFSLEGKLDPSHRYEPLPIWDQIADHGIVHHIYDGVLGALAARAGWETWYLPVACEHYGGRTAVGDRGYQAWAASQIPGGDNGYWEQSHKRAYEWLTDVLPLRV